jgi:hypothetical protein
MDSPAIAEHHRQTKMPSVFGIDGNMVAGRLYTCNEKTKEIY